MENEPTKYVSTDLRKCEIAKAASALIVEKGIDALRTRDVAARVGINIATLHYHVPGKDALIDLVIEMLRQEIEAPAADPKLATMDPLSLLEAEIFGFKKIMVERADLLQLFDDLWKRARVDTRIETRLREIKIGWHLRFVSIFSKGRETGQFRSDLDVEAFSHIVTGALVAFQYKPRHLLPVFDKVAAEIIRSVCSIEKKEP